MNYATKWHKTSTKESKKNEESMMKRQRYSKKWKSMLVSNKDKRIVKKRTSKNLPMINKLRSAKTPTTKDKKLYVSKMSWTNKRKNLEITRKISRKRRWTF